LTTGFGGSESTASWDHTMEVPKAKIKNTIKENFECNAIKPKFVAV